MVQQPFQWRKNRGRTTMKPKALDKKGAGPYMESITAQGSTSRLYQGFWTQLLLCQLGTVLAQLVRLGPIGKTILCGSL